MFRGVGVRDHLFVALYSFRNKIGSFAIFTASRRASSLSKLAAEIAGPNTLGRRFTRSADNTDATRQRSQNDALITFTP